LARPLALEPGLPRRLLSDPGARAISVPLRLPKGPIAPLAELWWHHEQMERLAHGGEPKLSASPKFALMRMMLRDRLLGWRRRRNVARQSALRQLSTDSA
ncbi:MAG: hypothetical protein H0U68_08775, partial [Ramlibacter sp.]|nr:hypothetical protein [Ramlibacter sp.]